MKISIPTVKKFLRVLLSLLVTGFALASASVVEAQTNVIPTNPPPPVWEGSAAAGLTLTRGNSRTVLGTVNIQASRKTLYDELLLGGDAA